MINLSDSNISNVLVGLYWKYFSNVLFQEELWCRILEAYKPNHVFTALTREVWFFVYLNSHHMDQNKMIMVQTQTCFVTWWIFAQLDQNAQLILESIVWYISHTHHWTPQGEMSKCDIEHCFLSIITSSQCFFPNIILKSFHGMLNPMKLLSIMCPSRLN